MKDRREESLQNKMNENSEFVAPSDPCSQNLWGVAVPQKMVSETEEHVSSLIVGNIETPLHVEDSIPRVWLPACLAAFVMHVMILVEFGYFGSLGEMSKFSSERFRIFDSSTGELLSFDNNGRFLLISSLASTAFVANAFRGVTSLPFVAPKQRPAV